MQNSTSKHKKVVDPITALEGAENSLGRTFVEVMERLAKRDPADNPHTLITVANEVLHSRQAVTEALGCIRRLYRGGAAA
jgi:hypothetical protein